MKDRETGLNFTDLVVLEFVTQVYKIYNLNPYSYVTQYFSGHGWLSPHRLRLERERVDVCNT